ncbi:MAG: glycosyltransferase family 2 protein [Bryobacteraceae bacterium]|jgi:glycosyltransferase involved in cell wall biosynthesis
MPAYNEADIIEACIREWFDEVASRIPGSEIIVVNDCSTDNTEATLCALEGELPGVRHLLLTRNSGHGRALRAGLEHATQPYVFQTDSDRQHLPADFWKLWDMRTDHDFVFGIRPQRADGALRIAITNVMRLLNLALWGIWVRDANCPFKLMRREALATVLARIPRDCFIPMVLVSVLARKMNFRIATETVKHLPRKGGTQSLKGLVKWTRISFVCARQLLAIRLYYAINRGRW